MKSLTKGNAGPDAPLGDSGAMPMMAGDDAYREGSPVPGGQDPARAPLRELMDDRLLTTRLGYDRHDRSGYHSGNSRNRSVAKTV